MKSTSITKQCLHYVEYSALRLLCVILRMLPENFTYGFARILGYCTYHYLRIRRDVTLTNLHRALGDELSQTEIESIAQESYCQIGMTFIEILIVPKFKNRILEIVDASEITVLKRSIQKGRGVIIVSCHFGSWELNGASILLSGIPVTVVAKKQSNPYVDSFITSFRREFGMKIVPPGTSIKHIVRALRKGEAVGLISDQDAGKNGVFVSFFGHKASTPRGAAQLALKYKAPIIVTMAMRTGLGRYKSFYRNVAVHDDDTVESLTQRFTTIMEEIIRQNPQQYFWMHRRWKTHPPDERSDNDENSVFSSEAGNPSGGE